MPRSLLAAAALAAASLAAAQSTRPALSVEGQVVATDNGALSAEGAERRELITSLRPQLVWVRRGAGLQLDLQAAATLIGYANDTQDGGVLPDVRAAMKAVLVERLLFVDALAQVQQSEVDPFGTRTDPRSGANRQTQGTYRISPAIERDFGTNLSFLARHEATLTTNSAGVDRRLVTQRSLLKLEREPVPLGAAVELTRLDNELRGAAQSDYTLDTARFRASVALGGQWVLGLVAGTDRSRFVLAEQTDSLYGIAAQWEPSPRTTLSANLEDRFFGRAGALELRHRMPFMSIALAMSRQPATASSSLGVLGPGADVRGFLDAILTTRHPDPAARAELVETLVTSRGLDTSLQDPIDVVAEYPQLHSAAQIAWTLLGTRNTLSLTLYGQSLRRLTRAGDPLSSLAAGADSRQHGGSLQFNRRLTPQLAADALLRWSRIEGLAERAGDISEERSAQLTLLRHLSPRTSASAGLRHKRFTTTVSGQDPYDATLLLMGMTHRF